MGVQASRELCWLLLALAVDVGFNLIDFKP